MAASSTYDLSEAKDWAREHFRGVCNVIIPSYSADASALNEAGIRHDVRRNMELGFWGALLVSEASTTAQEMRQFMEIAVDEADGEHYFLLHGSFDSLELLVQMARDAKAIGVDGVLLCYPNSFYPKSVDALTEYVRTYAEKTELATVLFAAPHFNFLRLSQRGYPMEGLLEAVRLPNIVAVKYEVGQPGTVGSYETFLRLQNEDVLVTDPFEPNLLLWMDIFDVPWMGTSNYEYLGASVPKMVAHMNAGEREAAFEEYWRVQPARSMRAQLQAAFAGANFNHRYLWKYQAWLQGYNGGPIRQPAMKLTDTQMRTAATGVYEAGLIDEIPTDFASFFVGRNPC